MRVWVLHVTWRCERRVALGYEVYWQIHCPSPWRRMYNAHPWMKSVPLGVRWGCIRVSGLEVWVTLDGGFITNTLEISYQRDTQIHHYFLCLTKEQRHMHMNVCPCTQAHGSWRNIIEHPHTHEHRYKSTGCIRQLAEHCVPTRRTISIYSHVCPGNSAWNVADCYCISLLQVEWVQAIRLPVCMCECLSLFLSLTLFSLFFSLSFSVQWEKTWSLSPPR